MELCVHTTLHLSPQILHTVGASKFPANSGPTSILCVSLLSVSALPPATMIRKQVGGFSSHTGAQSFCPGRGITSLHTCCDLFQPHSPVEDLCKRYHKLLSCLLLLQGYGITPQLLF